MMVERKSRRKLNPKTDGDPETNERRSGANVKEKNPKEKGDMIDSNSRVNEEGPPNPNGQPHTTEKVVNNGKKENITTFLTGSQLGERKGNLL